jgi:rod shape-determining protein MreD
MLVESRPGLFYSMVVVSILLGYLFMLFPLAPNYQMLRPELVCLLLIYWVMSVPQHIGVTFAFFVGLVQGVLEQSVWGAHAFALASVAFFCAGAYKRIRNYGLWQQVLWVFILVGVHQVLVNLILSFMGYQARPGQLLSSIVISALFWPPLVVALRKFRQHFRLV